MTVAQGVLREPDARAIFGMHISTELEAGEVAHRFGGLLAGIDRFRVTIMCRQTDAAARNAEPRAANA